MRETEAPKAGVYRLIEQGLYPAVSNFSDPERFAYASSGKESEVCFSKGPTHLTRTIPAAGETRSHTSASDRNSDDQVLTFFRRVVPSAHVVQADFRLAVAVQDHHCLVSDKAYYACQAAHVVPHCGDDVSERSCA